MPKRKTVSLTVDYVFMINSMQYMYRLSKTVRAQPPDV